MHSANMDSQLSRDGFPIPATTIIFRIGSGVGVGIGIGMCRSIRGATIIRTPPFLVAVPETGTPTTVVRGTLRAARGWWVVVVTTVIVVVIVVVSAAVVVKSIGNSIGNFTGTGTGVGIGIACLSGCRNSFSQRVLGRLPLSKYNPTVPIVTAHPIPMRSHIHRRRAAFGVTLKLVKS